MGQLAIGLGISVEGGVVEVVLTSRTPSGGLSSDLLLDEVIEDNVYFLADRCLRASRNPRKRTALFLKAL